MVLKNRNHPRYGEFLAKKNDAGEKFTEEEIEFMKAMERYTREKKPFPNCRDVLIVANMLGYTREENDPRQET